MVMGLNKKILYTCIVLLTIIGIAGIVFAYTDDTNPNYIQGFITINNTKVPSGTNFSVNVTSGDNAGCYYNGTVNSTSVPITRRQIGAYATGDQVCFNTNANFIVTIPGFSQNITGTFATGGNGNLITYTNLVNLSANYPENFPPTTTFNSSSTDVTSSNGWYNSSVNVTLFPNDNPRLVGSGIQATYYDINETGEQSGTNFLVSSDGNNTITYHSVDNNGSIESNQTTYINIDSIVPSVTINPVTSPTNVSTQIINGTFNESGSGIATIVVNGVVANLSGYNYSASITLTEGINTINVNATDNASSTGTNSTSIILDTTAPVVIINAVTSPVNATSQTIYGTFIETGTGIATIEVNGVNATLGDSNYSATVPLIEGTNTINVNATDNLSNVGTNNTTIVRDTISPALSSIANSTPTSNSVIITWTTNESATSVVKYNISSGNLDQNSTNSTLTTSHSITLTGLLANTTYDYVVNGTDAAGNFNQSAVNNFTTAPAPTVIIISPEDTIYNTSTIPLNSSFAGQNVSYAWYKLDNNANSTPAANITFLNATLTVSPDGQHNITVFANDSAGELGQSTRHFAVDTTGPLVLIDPVTSPTNATSQVINGTFIENVSGIAEVTVNGITANLSGDSFSASVPLSVEGINTIIVNATDNVSNTGTNSTTIVRDTIAPAVTINSVTSPTNATSQTINGTFSETGSGIAIVTVNGITANLSGNNYSASVPLSIEGTNTIHVNATDNASNTGTNNATIVRDTIAPAVTISSVTSPTNASSQTINGTFTETGSGIATVIVNGITANLSGYNYSALVPLSVEGTNTIHINATDNSNNRGTNNTTILLDTIAPIITINPVTSPVNATSQTITGTFVETGSGIATVIVNGITADLSGNNYSASISLDEGTNIINVNATDNVSNIGTNNTTILRDTISPAIYSIVNLTPSSVSVTITWETDEVATSVVNYNTSSGILDHNSSNLTLTTSHSITLTGLMANTTYYYAVNSTDAAGNFNQSAVNNFTTAPAPTVIIISPQEITYNTTSISLNTSFGGQNVSYAWYKLDNNANSTPAANMTYLNATLTVSPDGQHNITVYANDSAGYLGQSTVNFTIDTTGPVISNILSINTTSNSTTITWTTDENATSLVKYGTNSSDLNLNASNLSNVTVTSHSINLTNLVQNTTYYYVVNSTDAVSNSNQSSPVRQFNTSQVYGSLNGTITDAKFGSIIANVTVILYNASGGTYTTTSDSNGSYVISNLITSFASPYAYTIYATKTNYTGTSEIVAVNASIVTTLDFTMTMYNGTLMGSYHRNGTSIGISGATISLTNATLGTIVRTTDTSGTYFVSLYPAIYTLNVLKTGFSSNSTSSTVVSNTTTSVSAISLSLNTVTVTADRLVGSADSGQNVSFNLTVVNTGDDATFSVSTSITNASTTVATTTTPATLLLDATTSTGYVDVEINNSNFGAWPVTITLSNGSQSKNASITLTANMRDSSAAYTNISSNVINATVNGSTLVDAIVQNGATVSGNDTTITNATVTGENTVITNGTVIRGEYGDTIIDNSTLGNATVVSSNITGSTIRSNASITNSTLISAIVTNSTLTNVNVTSSSTITNVANLTNITIRGVDVIGLAAYDFEGELQGGASEGSVEYQGINFTRIYVNTLISQLVIEQSPDQDIVPGSNFSINDTSLGTSMNFSMIVNLSNPAAINITETGISPDGTGFSSGTRLGNFLYIRSNDTNSSNVTSHVLRLYFDINPSTYTYVRIYYYNLTSSAWEALATSGSGTEGGRFYVEATPNHFSTFALLGTTTTTPPSGGGGGGNGVSGGGGVVTAEPYDNIARSETHEMNLVSNKPVLYVFKVPELGIYEISVTGKESENNIALKVELLKGPTKMAKISEPPGSVYKNLNIWAASKRIQEGIIRFKVENTWIANNKIAGGDILMVRWNGNEWAKLETSELKKDDTYTFYEAKTEGFANFAITTLKGPVVTTTPAAIQITGTPIKPAGTETAIPAPTKETPGFEVISLIAGILASAFVLRRKI